MNKTEIKYDYFWDDTTLDWKIESKEQSIYDKNGYLLETIWYSLDKLIDKLKIDSKVDYEYYEDGKKKKSIKYFWDDHDWKKSRETEYQYNGLEEKVFTIDYEDNGKWKWEWIKQRDNNGNLILEAEYYLDPELGKWKGADKSEYTYDNKRNNITEIVYHWNDDTNDWETMYKFEREYNNIGKITKDECLYQYAGIWKMDEKVETEYDSKGNIIKEKICFFDEQISFETLKISSLGTDIWCEQPIEYFYDNLDNLIKKVTYSWDFVVGDSVLYSKSEYVYDELGNEIEEVYSEWDEEIGDWKKDWKRKDTYNTNNIKIREIYYKWSENKWKNLRKWELEFLQEIPF